MHNNKEARIIFTIWDLTLSISILNNKKNGLNTIVAIKNLQNIMVAGEKYSPNIFALLQEIPHESIAKNNNM